MHTSMYLIQFAMQDSRLISAAKVILTKKSSLLVTLALVNFVVVSE